MLRRASKLAGAAATAIGVVCALLVWLGMQPVEASSLDVCASGCAFASIQAAVNAANNGDLIRIAAGAYTESVGIVKPLTLRGAYSGPPSWTRDRAQYTTTIVGDGLQSVVVIKGPVLTPISVTLDGLTIRKGRGAPFGGGVRASGAHVSLLDNLVANNTLTATDFLTTALGAGVYVEGGSLWASGNTFSHNINDCAGLYCPTNDGGGLFVTGTVTTTLVNNLFDANQSWRGAALASFNTPLYAAGNTFQNNSGEYGSAIYAEGEPLLVVERNTFASNNAGSRGTLMLYNAGGLLLSRNVFTDNNGYDESVLAYFTGKPVTMVNNLVVNNRGSRYVHGLSVLSADGLFVNNTFANFSAPSQTVPVLFLAGGAFTLANNIFFSLTTGISLPYNSDSAWLSHNAFYSNTHDWNGAGIVLGAGNLTTTNPLFVDPPRDYHLRQDSQLRDKGDSAYNPGVDFEGDARSNPPDIGADEFLYRDLLPFVRKP